MQSTSTRGTSLKVYREAYIPETLCSAEDNASRAITVSYREEFGVQPLQNDVPELSWGCIESGWFQQFLCVDLLATVSKNTRGVTKAHSHINPDRHMLQYQGNVLPTNHIRFTCTAHLRAMKSQCFRLWRSRRLLTPHAAPQSTTNVEPQKSVNISTQ
jgi:hypothetical protein